MNLRIMLKLLHTLEQLRKHEHWTRQQLTDYQAKALLELRKYAYKRSPFYQRFHKGLVDQPLHELPVLTKSMMMENFDALVTDRTLHLEDIRLFAEQGAAGQRFKNRYYVNATSGSSGHPGFFLFDESEWAAVLASLAGALAEEQLAQRLKIHPKVVYVASEVLTTQTKQRVKEAWGDGPYNQYASTETASVASEHISCRHLHFYEDLLITEVVDEEYRPVPVGESGPKVLVTTLFSRTQPLIRYELNDSVRVSSATHTCGLPFAVLESVQGRAEDSLTLPAISGGEVLIRPLVINRIMDIAPVSGWQISQQADQGLVVLLNGTRNGMRDEWLAEQINKSLLADGAQVPYVRIQRVSEIPKTAAGKSPLIKAYRPPSL